MRDLKIYITIGSLILMGYLVAQYNKPKPVDWSPTFLKEDKIPYGSYIFYKRLKDIFYNDQVKVIRLPTYNALDTSNFVNGNYILIAEKASIDEYDFGRLKQYMAYGNDVFIASQGFSSYFKDSLKIKVNSELKPFTTKGTAVNFTNPKLRRAKSYEFDKDLGQEYFGSFDSVNVTVLGRNSWGHANFLKYSYGNGNLYLIASPRYFTNYSLLKSDGAEYAAKAISYLKPRGEIIWDEFSSRGREDEDASILQVFFRHPQLKWAYYTALASLILFVVYEVKRRQRIIPVADPMKNSTLEFVNVVGNLYFHQHDNRNIAQKKILFLLEYIRNTFQLSTSKLDKNFSADLVSKSGVDRNLVHALLEGIKMVDAVNELSDHQLIELNKNIDKFLKLTA